MGLLEGRTAIVTGAGGGIGRSEALSLARQGAHVVVNDIGVGDAGGRAADLVVGEIHEAGGSGETNFDDIGDWDGAAALIEQAIAHDGVLDILVCNAGVVRDRTLVNMTLEEWDAVIHVHLAGTFGPMRFAAQHWRDRAKAGMPPYGRVITTSSEAGLFGHPGQLNYSAAKAGIVAMSVVASRELERYGVTVNTICPRARTPMTEGVVAGMEYPRPGEVDDWDPDNIATFVTYLATPEAAEVSGQVFAVFGRTVRRMQMWPLAAEISSDQPWTLSMLISRMPDLGDGGPMRPRPFAEYMK
jgi:NAD(P)-dependent dehydrogenase (short-subunit alcohol dehydrogenase family)